MKALKNKKVDDAKVNLNSASITVLENSVKTLNKRKDEQSVSGSSSQLQPGDNGSTIAEAVATQTCFNIALQLG